MLVGDPPFGFHEAAWLDRKPMLSAANLSANESGRLEHRDVTGNSSEAHRKRVSEIANSGITRTKRDKECAPSRMGKCRKGAV
jgi:hypothetical protein